MYILDLILYSACVMICVCYLELEDVTNFFFGGGEGDEA